MVVVVVAVVVVVVVVVVVRNNIGNLYWLVLLRSLIRVRPLARSLAVIIIIL